MVALDGDGVAGRTGRGRRLRRLDLGGCGLGGELARAKDDKPHSSKGQPRQYSRAKHAARGGNRSGQAIKQAAKPGERGNINH